MNLCQVEYFVKAADCTSFSRAADELFVTQQAVSKAVACLEGELGARLFDRTPSGLVLTSEGGLAYERAKMLLGDAKRLAECVKGAGPQVGAPRRRIVRMAVSDVIVGRRGFVALDDLADFERACSSEVRLDITEATSDACLDALLDGKADAAVVMGPGNRPGLTSRRLRQEELAVFAARGNPLAELGAVDAERLAEQEFLIPRGATESVEVVRAGLYEAGADMPARERFAMPDCSASMLIDLVCRSQKVGLIPRRHKAFVEAAGGAVVSAPRGLLHLPISMVAREGYLADACLVELRDFLLGLFGDPRFAEGAGRS